MLQNVIFLYIYTIHASAGMHVHQFLLLLCSPLLITAKGNSWSATVFDLCMPLTKLILVSAFELNTGKVFNGEMVTPRISSSHPVKKGRQLMKI